MEIIELAPDDKRQIYDCCKYGCLGIDAELMHEPLISASTTSCTYRPEASLQIIAYPYWHCYAERRPLSHTRFEWIHYCHVSESSDSWKGCSKIMASFLRLIRWLKRIFRGHGRGRCAKSQYWFNLAFTSCSASVFGEKKSDLIFAFEERWHKMYYSAIVASASELVHSEKWRISSFINRNWISVNLRYRKCTYSEINRFLSKTIRSPRMKSGWDRRTYLQTS